MENTTSNLHKLEIKQINQELDIKKLLFRSFQPLVMKRMLDIVQQEGRIKPTKLANKAGLNYAGGIAYINILLLFGWIRTPADNNQITLTENGVEIINRIDAMD